MRGARRARKANLMQPDSTHTLIAGAVLGLGLLSLIAGFLLAKTGARARAPKLVDYLAGANDAGDFSTALQASLASFMADVGADHGFIRLIDSRAPGDLRVVVTHATTDAVLPDKDNSYGVAGISGLSFSQRQTLLVTGNTHADLVRDEFVEVPSSVLCVPITVLEATGSAGSSLKKAVGVIVVATRGKTKPILKARLSIARAYGEVISMLVHSRQMNDFSRETILDSLQEIADLLDSKDPFTVGHSRRTAEIARAIAVKMGLDDEACHEIWSAAKLIDLGKVSVPDSILKKNSGLTDEEFDTVKQHPLVSYEICRKLRLPESVLMIVRNHHERLDGSGYPDQLRGGELPLGLRIVSVADAYDAMRCARPHRPGLSAAEALHQLVQESGTKHDSSVVEAVRVLTDERQLEHFYDQEPTSSPALRVA